MPKKTHKTHSVRVPVEIYNLIQSSAAANNRNIVSEISLIISSYFQSQSSSSSKSNFMKFAGCVKDLKPSDYSGSEDELLYGGD